MARTSLVPSPPRDADTNIYSRACPPLPGLTRFAETTQTWMMMMCMPLPHRAQACGTRAIKIHGYILFHYAPTSRGTEAVGLHTSTSGQAVTWPVSTAGSHSSLSHHHSSNKIYMGTMGGTKSMYGRAQGKHLGICINSPQLPRAC